MTEPTPPCVTKELLDRILQVANELFQIHRAIQSMCTHNVITVREFPDDYAGWKITKECVGCGKNTGVFTRHRTNNDEIKKFRIERRDTKHA